jgi:hypothetical protein
MIEGRDGPVPDHVDVVRKSPRFTRVIVVVDLAQAAVVDELRILRTARVTKVYHPSGPSAFWAASMSRWTCSRSTPGASRRTCSAWSAAARSKWVETGVAMAASRRVVDEGAVVSVTDRG